MIVLPLTEFPNDGLTLYHKCHHAHSWHGQDAAEIHGILLCGGGLIGEELFADFNDESEGSDESYRVDGSDGTAESAGSKEFMKPLKLSGAARVRGVMKVMQSPKSKGSGETNGHVEFQADGPIPKSRTKSFLHVLYGNKIIQTSTANTDVFSYSTLRIPANKGAP